MSKKNYLKKISLENSIKFLYYAYKPGGIKMKIDKALHDTVIGKLKKYTEQQYEEMMGKAPALALRYYNTNKNNYREYVKLTAVFKDGFMPRRCGAKPMGFETFADGFWLEYAVGECCNDEIYTELEEAVDAYLRIYNLINTKNNGDY